MYINAEHREGTRLCHSLYCTRHASRLCTRHASRLYRRALHPRERKLTRRRVQAIGACKAWLTKASARGVWRCTGGEFGLGNMHQRQKSHFWKPVRSVLCRHQIHGPRTAASPARSQISRQNLCTRHEETYLVVSVIFIPSVLVFNAGLPTPQRRSPQDGAAPPSSPGAGAGAGAGGRAGPRRARNVSPETSNARMPLPVRSCLR